ncbi:MAG: GldM family protein [Ferruginibacter sp.]
MKQIIVASLLIMGMMPVNSQLAFVRNTTSKPVESSKLIDNEKEGFNICSQPSPENEKMQAVIFRKQDFCRAELKDFDFDVHFDVVSATVYFSGTNFKNVESGYINSNSLKPIRSLMDRCAPGSMVIFDNVKVKGPDNTVRPIQGTSYLLH